MTSKETNRQFAERCLSYVYGWRDQNAAPGAMIVELSTRLITAELGSAPEVKEIIDAASEFRDCEHAEPDGEDYAKVTDASKRLDKAVDAYRAAYNKIGLSPSPASEKAVADYVMVPRTQIEKVERCRVALNSVIETLEAHNFPVWAYHIRQETVTLWEVANRRYAAAPSAPDAGGWISVKHLSDMEVHSVRADQNTTHILRLDKDLNYWLFELPPLPAPPTPSPETEKQG